MCLLILNIQLFIIRYNHSSRVNSKHLIGLMSFFMLKSFSLPKYIRITTIMMDFNTWEILSANNARNVFQQKVKIILLKTLSFRYYVNGRYKRLQLRENLRKIASIAKANCDIFRGKKKVLYLLFLTKMSFLYHLTRILHYRVTTTEPSSRNNYTCLFFVEICYISANFIDIAVFIVTLFIFEFFLYNLKKQYKY